MFKNYLTIAWRNLIRNKAYSAINMLGLSAGMAVALLIGLWIWDEVSFNKNFDNYDRIVRVMETINHGGEISTGQAVPLPLGNELRTVYGSDFKRLTVGSGISKHILSYNGDKQIFGNGIYIQPEFLAMFSVRLLKGSHASLDDPYSTVISASLAKTMFGNADPLGKLVKIDNWILLKISGVYRDFPHNCEFYNTQLLMAWDGFAAKNDLKGSMVNGWNNNSWQIFAQLQDNADLNAVSVRVRGGLEDHDRKDKPVVLLHPMSKWRLYSEFKTASIRGVFASKETCTVFVLTINGELFSNGRPGMLLRLK